MKRYQLAMLLPMIVFYNVIVKKIADVLIEIEPHDTFQFRVPIPESE